MPKKKICYPWALNWAKSVPDPILQKGVERGFIDPECLPPERRRRLGLVEEKKEAKEKVE